jgi:hypothetical protein
MPRTTNPSGAVNILRDATSRDFRGGLDVADSELNLSSKFARVLDNMVVGLDGTLDVRQGTKLFTDLAKAGSSYPIVNMEFFYKYIISVTTRGEVYSTDGTGASKAIWTSAISGSYSPPRTIWQSALNVVFGQFDGELIIMNGVDKPLMVTNLLHCDYLADKGSGSNINVPIGGVCATFANHFFIASGYMLNVSERNASGTWLGDVGAVYVNNFDMRPYVPYGDVEILGLYPFKGYLMVAFREVVIPIQIVEDSTATPPLNITVDGFSILNNYGAISARVGQDVGDEALLCDIGGVSSVSLNAYTRALSPDRPSRFVDPILQPALASLSLDTLRDDVFSVFDRKLSAYALFVPDGSMATRSTSIGYVYRYVKSLSVEAWSLWKGNNWHCACRSSEGNVFFARPTDAKIFVKGDPKINPIFADYVGEQETFTDDTIFSDGTGLTPVGSDVRYSGIPIQFTWELPWADLRHRGLAKTLRYIVLDTEGDQEFTMNVFVDDKYIQANVGENFSDGTFFTDGTGWMPFVIAPYTPALKLNWIGRDAYGYGLQPYGNSPYGGGNNTALRTLSLAPTKFNTMKLRFEGSVKGPLKFVAITLLYQMGTIRRLP